MTPKLKSMIGSFIFVRLVSGDELQKLKLLGVEFGGIWVESEQLTAGFVSLSEGKMIANTPVVFLPYARLAAIVAAMDMPAFDEKSLGL
jgi:hypothetical protein